MATWREWLRRFWGTFRPIPSDIELEEELSLHLALASEDLQRRGDASDSARRSARLKVGGISEAMDALRDQRGMPWLESILGDIRLAGRSLAGNPGLTAVAVLTLALGIGANTAIFTIVNAALLRDLPFERPDRMVRLGTRDGRGRELGVSTPDFMDWRAVKPQSFSGLTLISPVPLNLSGDDRLPEQVAGAYLSGNAFTMIGEKAAIGRIFTEEDDREGAAAVVVLSDSVWKTRYGGDPSIVGRTIRLSGLPTTVVGVMREGMKFPFNNDLWLPLVQQPAVTRAAPRQARVRPVMGRLAEGATIEQARAEMAAIGAELARRFPETNGDMVPSVTPYAEREFGGQINVKVLFWSLMGAVAFVLLIACANVANLLLARATHRSKEVGIRVSLGATRGRVIRQLLVESVLLAAVAGVLGFGLSVLGLRWFVATTTEVSLPYYLAFDMDLRVFAFFAAVSLATGIIFGLAPALHVSRTNVNEVVKESGRSGSGGVRTRRWTAALIVGELALTLVLLAGAGFTMRSFLALYRVDLGFDTSQLLTMSVRTPAREYPTIDSRVAFLRRLEQQLAPIAEIQSASTTTHLPLGVAMPRPLELDGRPVSPGDAAPTVAMLSVGARYFETMGVKPVRGRVFNDIDGSPGHDSAIVNQQFARMHFANVDPLGQRIRVTEPPPNAPQAGWVAIVGVVPTIRQGIQPFEIDPVVYLPHQGNPYLPRDVTIMVRGRGDPAALAPRLREEVRTLDPDMPLFDIRPLDEVFAQTRWAHRTFGTMFSIFAVIALVLSTVGLYAVTDYSVTQRRQEIGLRMALGAEPRQITWLVLKSGLLQVAAGLVLGFAGAVGVGRLLQSLLFRTSPTDAVTLAGISLVLIAAAVTACLRPARHAMRLDPNVALRCE